MILMLAIGLLAAAEPDAPEDATPPPPEDPAMGDHGKPVIPWAEPTEPASVSVIDPGKGARRALGRVPAGAWQTWAQLAQRFEVRMGDPPSGEPEVPSDTVVVMHLKGQGDDATLTITEADAALPDLQAVAEVAHAGTWWAEHPWPFEPSSGKATPPVPWQRLAIGPQTVGDWVLGGLNLLLLPMPEERVGRGATWTFSSPTYAGSALTGTATLTAVRKNRAVVEVTYDMESGGDGVSASMVGRLWLDTRLGVPAGGEVILTMTATGDKPGTGTVTTTWTTRATAPNED